MLNWFVRKWVILLITKVLAKIIGISQLFAYPSSKGRLPPISNEILYLSATKIAEKVRNGKLTSECIIRAYISRCQEVNPFINAIVDSKFEQAIADAKDVDLLIASKTKSIKELETTYPLLGVPVTVKESIGVKGFSHQAGRIIEPPHCAEEDAECIKQLKAAGAIILLVSNTPELCGSPETFNYITGTTRNPYDLRRTPGGSSGGEAALLSAAASVIGIGSDGAGSLRIPAMFCGVFGYKGTRGLVPNAGHVPSSSDFQFEKLLCMGPLVRYVEDIALVSKVLKSPNSPELKPVGQMPISEIKFYFKMMDTSGITKPISKSVLNAMKKVIQHFKINKQINPQEVKLDSFDSAFEFGFLALHKIKGMETVLSYPEDFTKWRSLWRELIKKFLGVSNYQITSLFYCGSIKFFNSLPRWVFDQGEILEKKCDDELSEILQDNGVLFYPVSPDTAYFHGSSGHNFWDPVYTIVFNVLGYPSISCPVGFDDDGLPVGIQIVANRGCDLLLMTVAMEMETAFGGWKPPK